MRNVLSFLFFTIITTISVFKEELCKFGCATGVGMQAHEL